VEAASHDAVREYGEALLKQGISFVALSGGALCDDALRDRLERAAAQHRALLYVPAGGIGGLDALKAACLAGADEVSIAVTKPPVAWKGFLTWSGSASTWTGLAPRRNSSKASRATACRISPPT
jgi:aspartate dehydrogenase